MVVPFLIIYLFNWVLFSIIIISLVRKNIFSTVRPKKDNNISFFYQQLSIAITLSVLFGLGWGIGLLATQDIHTNKTVRDMFAALFVIITAFHGLFIFIMQCLRSIDVRNSWKRCFFGMTGKHVSEFSSSTLPRKHQQQIQAKEKSGRTNKLADITKESSIFGHKDLTSEKHSIDKDKEIENLFEEEKIGPPIVIAMENINTEEENNVDEVLAETSLAKSLSDEAKQSQHDEETVATYTD